MDFLKSKIKIHLICFVFFKSNWALVHASAINRQQAIAQDTDAEVLQHHMASLGHKDFSNIMSLTIHFCTLLFWD